MPLVFMKIEFEAWEKDLRMELKNQHLELFINLKRGLLNAVMLESTSFLIFLTNYFIP
jgi:hypothetical protein